MSFVDDDFLSERTSAPSTAPNSSIIENSSGSNTATLPFASSSEVLSLSSKNVTEKESEDDAASASTVPDTKNDHSGDDASEDSFEHVARDDNTDFQFHQKDASSTMASSTSTNPSADTAAVTTSSIPPVSQAPAAEAPLAAAAEVKEKKVSFNEPISTTRSTPSSSVSSSSTVTTTPVPLPVSVASTCPMSSSSLTNPGPCPYAVQRIFSRAQINPALGNLIYWKNPIHSGTVLAVSLALTYVFLLSDITLASLTSYLSVALLTSGLVYVHGTRIYSSFVKGQKAFHPFEPFFETNAAFPREAIIRYFSILLDHFAIVLQKIKGIYLIENTFKSLAFLVGSYLFAVCFGCFRFGTLLFASLVFVFSAPKIYEMKKVQIDAVFMKFHNAVGPYYLQVRAKINNLLHNKAKSD